MATEEKLVDSLDAGSCHPRVVSSGVRRPHWLVWSRRQQLEPGLSKGANPDAVKEARATRSGSKTSGPKEPLENVDEHKRKGRIPRGYDRHGGASGPSPVDASWGATGFAGERVADSVLAPNCVFFFPPPFSARTKSPKGFLILFCQLFRRGVEAVPHPPPPDRHQQLRRDRHAGHPSRDAPLDPNICSGHPKSPSHCPGRRHFQLVAFLPRCVLDDLPAFELSMVSPNSFIMPSCQPGRLQHLRVQDASEALSLVTFCGGWLHAPWHGTLPPLSGFHPRQLRSSHALQQSRPLQHARCQCRPAIRTAVLRPP